VQKLIATGKFLTIWGRFSAVQAQPNTIGSAMIYFPLIGLMFGLVLALLNYGLAPYLPPEILSMVLIMVLILLTGGIHLGDLWLTFNASRTKTLPAEYRGDASLGIIAIVIVLLFKSAATDSMDERLSMSLLLAPVLARWALLIFVYGYQHRCDEIAGVIAEQLRFWHLLAATSATLALSAYLLGRKGLWIALSLSLLVLLGRNLIYRLNAVVTQNNFGAVIEIAEALSLVLLASL
jgi:adenosylcobinamide-GDP ribazoletransferase